MNYVGEVRMFAGNFPPNGWMFCEGQLLPISENETLFQLIGTTYGGDGESTFALPDLRGRLPLHQGNGFVIGELGGAEEITLTVSQIPNHTHALLGFAGDGNQSTPAQGVWATSGLRQYSEGALYQTVSPAASSSPTGGSQPHTNFMPYLCVNFIISLYGIFPSQT